jgi:hypothetical protein
MARLVWFCGSRDEPIEQPQVSLLIATAIVSQVADSRAASRADAHHLLIHVSYSRFADRQIRRVDCPPHGCRRAHGCPDCDRESLHLGLRSVVTSLRKKSIPVRRGDQRRDVTAWLQPPIG